MGVIGHCRIVGFEYDMIKINLVAQTTEFCMAVSDILSIIILHFHSLCTEMFISSYAHSSRAIRVGFIGHCRIVVFEYDMIFVTPTGT